LYFVATSAVKFRFFKKEGLDVEFAAEYGAKHGPERLKHSASGRVRRSVIGTSLRSLRRENLSAIGRTAAFVRWRADISGSPPLALITPPTTF
jgi:hypothetical protein